MATKHPSVIWYANDEENVGTATWDLADGDDASPILMPDYADRCAQVYGNFGGGTVTIAGSSDGVNYSTLHDPQGNQISMASSGFVQLLEIPLYTKPVLNGGAGVSLSVSITLRK